MGEGGGADGCVRGVDWSGVFGGEGGVVGCWAGLRGWKGIEGGGKREEGVEGGGEDVWGYCVVYGID